MKKGLIIGISGKMGSGKDTTGEYLKRYGCKVENFAANVRRVCSILTGVPYDILLTREAKGLKVIYQSKQISMGELFQIIGNGLRELVDKDVWVNSLLNNISPDQLTVITDVRYLNEVKEIMERGGIIIRLEGDPAKIRDDIKSGKSIDKRDLNAISETELDNYNFKYIIYNTGTVEELYSKIDCIVKNI